MDSFVFVYDKEHSNVFEQLQIFFQSVGIFLYDYRLAFPQKKKVFYVPIVLFLTNPNIMKFSYEIKGKAKIFIANEKDRESFSHFEESIFYFQKEEEIIPFLLKEFSLTELLPYYDCYQKHQAYTFYHPFYSLQKENSCDSVYLEEVSKLVQSQNPYLLYAYAYLEALSHHDSLATPTLLNAYAQNQNLKECLFQLFKMYPTHQNKILLENKCTKDLYFYYLFYTLAPFSNDPLKEYQQCIEENTNFYPAIFKCAYMYEKKGNIYEAKRYFKNVLKILESDKTLTKTTEETCYIIESYRHLYALYLKDMNEVNATKMYQKLKSYLTANDVSNTSLLELNKKKIY